MPDHAKKVAKVKVVHLEPESTRLAKARIARLPAPVHAVHEKGKFLLAELLKQFFDRVDDSLFELADKASSNSEQNIYFDSMREVRVQRRGLERRFGIEIDAAFANLATGAQPEPMAVDEVFSADALSLVQNDDLEQMVAIESSVNRANAEYSELVQQLSLRLDTLVPVKVFEKNNPIGPSVVATAFMTQAKRLDIDIKAKLVLFKLFDRSVMHNLGSVYQTANQILIDHHILPSLSNASAARRQTASETRPEAPAVHESAPVVDNEMAQTLQNLLGASAGGGSSQPQLNELVRLLSLAQRSPASAPAAGDASAAGVSSLNLIEDLYRQKGSAAQISSGEREVINLVDMLFNFILADRNLSQPMKELLALMQIPVVKVSLLDKSFFAKGGHSARKLLNDMATAALGWQDSGDNSRDALYVKMQSIVNKLLTSFGTDVSIFNDLHADFSSFVDKERRRAEVIEKRTLDAEDGKARAEVARTVVSLEIELRTIDQKLPEVVTALVNGPWNNVMFVTYLKYGAKAAEWHSVLSTLDDLVWSVKPPRDNEDRKKLIRMVPELLKRLRAGLDSISFNPFQMAEVFKQLEDIHLSAIRGRSAPETTVKRQPAPNNKAIPGTIPKAKSPEAKIPASPAPAAQVAAPIPTQTNVDERKGNTPAARTPAAGAGKPPVASRAPVKPSPPPAAAAPKAAAKSPDPVSGNVPPVAPKTLEPAVAEAIDDPFVKQADTFSQGGWFELIGEEGEMIRCRLAAIIRPTGKYIFVNRNGMKVAEKSKAELVELLRGDRLRALDNTMLFDRALETVVSSLRKPQ